MNDNLCIKKVPCKNMLQVHNPGIWEKKAYIVKQAYQKKHNELSKHTHTECKDKSGGELQATMKISGYFCNRCMYILYIQKKMAAKVECSDEK